MDSNIPITVYGDVDPRAVEQMRRCANTGDAAFAGICADGHVGYSQPIGGFIGYRNFISPSGVGYDIGCGNKAVCTNIQTTHLKKDVGKIMDEIFARISFGMGRKNDEPVDHPIFDSIRDADFVPQRNLIDTAVKQLGTVGGGNHYVDLFAGDNGYVWIGVHFGSRGFGHKTATGFLAMAAGESFFGRATEGEMDSPPVLFHTDTNLGQSYIEAMTLAGEYAYAGRDVVAEKVLEILGAKAVYTVHNHHNFAWREEHNGELLWVIRKGCTPAFPGQTGFVGATMGEESVILGGVESREGAALLYSTVHGAGRVMSRTAAAGKYRSRWSCTNLECDWVQPNQTHKPEDGRCPLCGMNKLNKRRVRTQEGAIDWEWEQQELKDQDIELRGAGADEAPGAYKRLDDVLDYHKDSILILNRLRPIGVAMAGSDIYDPYKD